VKKIRDVAFIGHCQGRGHRREYVEALGIPVIQGVYREEHARTVGETNINLNFTEGGASDRVYKVMAAGGFLLSEPWPGMEEDFTPGVHLDTFGSVDELRRKIGFYLLNDPLRVTIAENGLRAVQKFSRDGWAKAIVGGGG
jgi:hypothetical protein